MNRLANGEGTFSGSGTAWLAIKLAIVGATAAIVIGGVVAFPGPTPIMFGAILLIPSLVFLVGVWSPRRVVVFGGLLVGITAATWLLYVINKRESMAAAGIFVGGFWSLVAALAGFSLEVGAVDASRSQGTLSHYRTPADPEGNEDSGQRRPRPW